MTTKIDDVTMAKLFSLRKPHDWTLTIGCTGVSAQIADEEKWCGLTSQATHLFVKEFVPNYHGNSVVPPWTYWEQYGVAIHIATSTVIKVTDLMTVHSADTLLKHLGRCMPRYIKYEGPAEVHDPYPDSVPMPGAGRETSTIKDVKGERLD